MAKLPGVRAITTLGNEQTTGTEFITGRQMHGLAAAVVVSGFEAGAAVDALAVEACAGLLEAVAPPDSDLDHEHQLIAHLRGALGITDGRLVPFGYAEQLIRVDGDSRFQECSAEPSASIGREER